ncbi:hypothetical protein E4T39_02000 [Aureobasidium subglaciale]|nr:hypothetical protein E4T39_02000 [Aureobasidium subglaciale]
MSRAQAKSFLTGSVLKAACSGILKSVSSKWFGMSTRNPTSKTSSPLLSLEVLVTTAYHQFRNELGALKRIFKATSPKIFIGEFVDDEDGLMACIYTAGLKHYLQITSSRT